MCLICNVAGSVSIFSAKPVGSQALLLPVILAYCIGDILALIFVYSFFFIPVFFFSAIKLCLSGFFLSLHLNGSRLMEDCVFKQTRR